ncbi:MAG: glycogen/starch/alpha-glucan phosphorylase [Acidilobus sp.]
MDRDVIVSVTPEIALDELYTYAGGLGVLEGDKFYAAARRGLRYYVLTLMYRRGYVSYSFDEAGNPRPEPQEHPLRIEDVLSPEPTMNVSLKGENVIVRPWIYERGKSRVVFFEAECPTWARNLSERTYIEGNYEENIYKYVLLAKASATYLRDYVGLERVRNIDLQEAYTVLVMLALPEFDNYRFTTHTPGPWGHPTFPTQVLTEEFGFGFPEPFVTLTEIGMQKAKATFTVSAKHEEITKKTFPKFASVITHVTNGIDLDRWVHPSIRSLLTSKGLDSITEDDVWKAHTQAKRDLINLVRAYKDIDESFMDKPVVVWLRRNTRYKRPYFIIRYIEENEPKDVLFVVGGKAHPRDVDGLSYMKAFHRLAKTYPNVVHVPDYDVPKAKVLQPGADIQTFTPFSGWEASGTSFMKSLANGVPVVSSRDGAAVEIIQHGVNGWLFGEDLRELINIYTDPKASEIDEKDYAEFERLLTEAINIYASDDFKRMALNAIKTSYKFVDINRVLDALYFPPRPATSEAQGSTSPSQP